MPPPLTEWRRPATATPRRSKGACPKQGPRAAPILFPPVADNDPRMRATCTTRPPFARACCPQRLLKTPLQEVGDEELEAKVAASKLAAAEEDEEETKWWWQTKIRSLCESTFAKRFNAIGGAIEFFAFLIYQVCARLRGKPVHVPMPPLLYAAPRHHVEKAYPATDGANAIKLVDNHNYNLGHICRCRAHHLRLRRPALGRPRPIALYYPTLPRQRGAP